MRPGRTPAPRGGLLRRRRTLVLAAAGAGALLVAIGVARSRGDGAAPSLLQWAPPVLHDPAVLRVPPDGGSFELEPGRDYRVSLPPVVVTGPVALTGGRNVVLIGGSVELDRPADALLSFKHFAGVLHVEGLHIDPGGSRGFEADAIRVVSSAEGSTAQLENLYVERVGGSYEGGHGDIVQTWGGPAVLRIDRLTGYSDYQGLYLAPNQFDWHPEVEPFELRHIDLHGIDDGSFNRLYTLSGRGGEPPSPIQHQLWAQVDSARTRVANDRWRMGVEDGIRLGEPPGSHFVRRGDVGLGYESPGYR